MSTFQGAWDAFYSVFFFFGVKQRFFDQDAFYCQNCFYQIITNLLKLYYNFVTVFFIVKLYIDARYCLFTMNLTFKKYSEIIFFLRALRRRVGMNFTDTGMSRKNPPFIS